ncbi:hypothetical protein QFZ83_005141 [Variovorax sp. W1I1]|nr:hypothetical protein [Variovorax sp. W1I1]
MPTGGANGFAPATLGRLVRGFSTAAVWLRLLWVDDAQRARTARPGLNATWLPHADFHSPHTRDRRPAWTHTQIDLQPAESVQVQLRAMSTGQIRPMMEFHAEGPRRHIERNHAPPSETPLFTPRKCSRDSVADTPQACCRSVP